jgi:hypothetical protein
MDPYWHQSSSGDGPGTPKHRKKPSSNGVARTSRDPILELMMCDLMQRQSLSNSGAKLSSNGAKQHSSGPEVIISHQPNISSSAQYAVGAAFPGGAPPRGCCSRLWQTCWFRTLLLAVLLAGVVLAIALPLGLRQATQGPAAAAPAAGPAAAAERRMQPPQGALGPRFNTTGMALVFADDFTSFDTSVWNYDIGDGSDYGLQR